MGSLDVASYTPIVAALVPMALAWAGFATLPRVLDLHQRRRRVGGGARRQRRAHRAHRAGQRVAGDRRGGVAGRPGSFVGIIVPHLVRLVVGADHRLVLPASALFGARLSDRLRPGRAHDHRAARAAGRHRHRDHRRAGFSMAAVPTRVRLAPLGARWCCRRRRCGARSPTQAASETLRGHGAAAQRRSDSAAPHHLAGAGDDRDAVRDGRRRPARRRQQLRPLPAGGRRGCRRSAGCSIPNVERVLSLKPDLVIVYDTQTDLKRQLERAQRADATATRIAACPTSPRRCARSASGSAPKAAADAAADAHRTAARRDSDAAWPARPRPRTLLVFGREPGHAAPHQRQRRLRLPARRARARRRRRRARPTCSSSRSR